MDPVFVGDTKDGKTVCPSYVASGGAALVLLVAWSAHQHGHNYATLPVEGSWCARGVLPRVQPAVAETEAGSG